MNEAELVELDRQLDNAEVSLFNKAESVYQVFVPGALRETNYVAAEDENEAIDKTRAVLVVKITEHNKKVAALPNGLRGEVTIQPQGVGGGRRNG